MRKRVSRQSERLATTISDPSNVLAMTCNGGFLAGSPIPGLQLETSCRPGLAIGKNAFQKNGALGIFDTSESRVPVNLISFALMDRAASEQ
jgi:hypothetical protein